MKYIVGDRITGQSPKDLQLDALLYMMSSPMVTPTQEPTIEYIGVGSRLLKTWRRLHNRYPLCTGFGVVAGLLMCPASALVATYRFTGGHEPAYNGWWAFAAWLFCMLGATAMGFMVMLVSQLLDADRAMRVRFKLRTGEDYDADPFA